MAGPEARALEAASFLAERDGLAPGLVIVDCASVTAEEILAVARPVTAANHGWMLALLEGEGDAVRVRVLSLSPAATLDEALAHVRDPAAASGTMLELQAVLARIARVRHDVNNPLTSALAEVQLALMDVEGDAAMKEALESVQTQLRRIRDLVASTGHLRPTRP